jgi:archaeal type IV pilus assembly protein PilA
MFLGNVLMNRQALFERARRQRKSGISPIIATLLLILIAIAAGVVVYAYVIGFVGNTTTGQGSGTSQLNVDTAAGKGSTGALTAFVRNIGGNTATLTAFYVLDSTGNIVAGGSFIGTTSVSSATACATITAAAGMACTLSAGSSVQINVAGGITMSAGSSYQLKVTTADGSSVIYSFKAN